MRFKPNKKTEKKREMSIDQQIQQCEEKIADMENWKRAAAIGDLDQHRVMDFDGNLERDLDKEYEQVALLKIRRMMGY